MDTRASFLRCHSTGLITSGVLRVFRKRSTFHRNNKIKIEVPSEARTAAASFGFFDFPKPSGKSIATWHPANHGRNVGPDLHDGLWDGRG